MQILEADLRSTPIFAALLREQPEVRGTLTSQAHSLEAHPRAAFQDDDDDEVVHVMPLPERQPGKFLRTTGAPGFSRLYLRKSTNA